MLVADIDTYVARTDPASLPDAEQALNAWEIPSDPLEGVPGDVALEPGVEGEPLVAVFAAQSESEANIVRGVVEAAGIPVTFDGLPAPIMGSVFQAGESRWGDLLVPASWPTRPAPPSPRRRSRPKPCPTTRRANCVRPLS